MAILFKKFKFYVKLNLDMDRNELFKALNQLRKGLLQTIIVIIILGIFIYPFSKTILNYLHKPINEDLVSYGVHEAFISILKLTLYGSLFFSIPLIFYRIFKSFSSFLKINEKKSQSFIILASIILFYLGSFFCYFVTLPFGIKFLLSYQSPHLKPMISVGKFVSFCAVFIFSFGLIFELPLVIALLSYIKIVNVSLLTRNRRYAILLIAIISAMLTPTPDAFNMALMGGPLYILFEIGVILARIIERKREALNTSF